MALFSVGGIGLEAISAAVPKQVVSNDDIELLTEAQRAKFVKAVGIRTRRVADPQTCASDLCIAAAQRVMKQAGLQPEDIGALVFVTQTPDFSLPGNSMIAQQRLSLPTSTYLLDLHQGCAGFVYGLASTTCLMNSTGIETALVLAGDTITRLLDDSDTSTVPIFSDAGSATLLTRKSEAPMMYFNLGSDGDGADVIQMKAGGARCGAAAVSAERPSKLSMRGVDVMQLSLKYVEPSIRELLDFSDRAINAVDFYVLHQANRILNRSLLKKLGVPVDKAPESLLDYGNTSVATIPLTICYRLSDALNRSTQSLLLAGFGAGFSWASALVETQHPVYTELFELD